jgi:hypothetical protein
MRTAVLSDIIELIGGGTPKTSKPEFWNGDIPWLSVVDFGGDGRWVDKAEKTITNLGLENSSTKLLKSGDIVISARGTVGELAQLKRPMAFNQSCYGIRARTGVDQDFLYYLLKKSVNDLRRQSHGGVFNTITRSTFDVVSISIPSIVTQKKIANILGSLDEKIELNRRMNETLEQLGQALFRHYFIDNSEVDSWESGEVSDVVRIYSGFAFKSKDFDIDGRYGLVTIKNVQDGSFIKDCTDHLSEPLPDKIPDHVHLKSGDIILSLTGNVGRVCAVVGHDYLLNQRVAKLVSNENQAYVYFLFRSKTMKDRMVGISKGTAQKNLSPIETGKLKIKIPPTNIMSQFEEIVIDLLNIIVSNNEQIQTLTSFRDSLLPKLISGEIEV